MDKLVLTHKLKREFLFVFSPKTLNRSWWWNDCEINIGNDCVV